MPSFKVTVYRSITLEQTKNVDVEAETLEDAQCQIDADMDNHVAEGLKDEGWEQTNFKLNDFGVDYGDGDVFSDEDWTNNDEDCCDDEVNNNDDSNNNAWLPEGPDDPPPVVPANTDIVINNLPTANTDPHMNVVAPANNEPLIEPIDDFPLPVANTEPPVTK